MVQISMAQLTALRSSFESELKHFAEGNATFSVLHSQVSGAPGTGPLYILDSSFNPPTKAHLQIAVSALRSQPGPKRLLLLLATQNADKAAKPAAFDQRLVMMTLLGEAVHGEMQEGAPPDVDVGVIKLPYYHDKAISIEHDARYETKDGVPVEQVHLTGFDSLLRIFDRKYYPVEEGFSVLKPLFKHRIRATIRPDDKWGDTESQEKYVEDIKLEKRTGEGIKKEWGERIELIEGKKKGEEAVSSTQARQAAREGDSEQLAKMVVPRVKEWIESEGLYKEDDLEKMDFQQ